MRFFENKIVQIIIACLIPFIGGWIISILTNSSMYPWYDTIQKPPWNPPSWIFAPVWTILYIMMGYASFRVWDEGDGFSGRARTALIIYIIHLIINLTWTIVFFGWHMIGLATIHIFILWIAVIVTAFQFYKIDRIAGFLFIPYFVWGTFASVLCFTIWRLNS